MGYKVYKKKINNTNKHIHCKKEKPTNNNKLIILKKTIAAEIVYSLGFLFVFFPLEIRNKMKNNEICVNHTCTYMCIKVQYKKIIVLIFQSLILNQ